VEVEAEEAVERNLGEINEGESSAGADKPSPLTFTEVKPLNPQYLLRSRKIQ
jgi:hypothetical protein